MGETFEPTEKWQLQAAYKKQLHERIQKWGESVVSYAGDVEDPEQEAKEQFFLYLMESVERDDKPLALLLQDLEQSAIEATRSWYSGELGSSNSDIANSVRLRHFNTLFELMHGRI